MVQVTIQRSDIEHTFDCDYAWTTFDGHFRLSVPHEGGIMEIVELFGDPDMITVHDEAARRDLVNADILELISAEKSGGSWILVYQKEVAK